MEDSEILFLRKVYTDICQGYSRIEINGKGVYVKHLNSFDLTEADESYDFFYEKAINRGLKPEIEKLKWLKEKRLWEDKDEVELETQKKFKENLEKTKGSLYLKAQVDAINKQLDEVTAKMMEIQIKKEKLVGLTAEKVASRKVQYKYIELSFFSDKNLSCPIYTADSLSEMDYEEVELILYNLDVVLNKISPKNIKKIALQPFFTNHFYLLNDDIHAFFDKPMVSLTIYQVNLLNYGQYYRNILKNNDIPDDIMSDPEKLENHITTSNNFKKVAKKTAKGDRVGIVGATAEDFKNAGLVDGTTKMRGLANKNYKNSTEAAKDLGFNYKN